MNQGEKAPRVTAPFLAILAQRRLKLDLIRSDLLPLDSKCVAVVRARLMVFSVLLLHVC